MIGKDLNAPRALNTTKLTSWCSHREKFLGTSGGRRVLEFTGNISVVLYTYGVGGDISRWKKLREFHCALQAIETGVKKSCRALRSSLQLSVKKWCYIENGRVGMECKFIFSDFFFASFLHVFLLLSRVKFAHDHFIAEISLLTFESKQIT